MVSVPPDEHWLVAIMAPVGIFYANAVGAFGVISAGQNLGRLAIAAHRRALSLVGNKKFFALLLSFDALFFGRNEIRGESFVPAVFFLMIIDYPFSAKKFLVRNDLVWLGFPIDLANKNAGIRSKMSFRARKTACCTKF